METDQFATEASAPSRTALVTGASSGIGAAVAGALAADGHRVLAAARRLDRLERLAAQTPGIVPLELDVTDSNGAESVIRSAAGETGVDLLVNNAGFAAVGPVEAIAEEEVRRQFDVNVHGLLTVTRAVLPGMRARGRGRILNISSVVGRVSFPGMGIYSASKHAVEALSDALRVEVSSTGIQVVLIEPGFVKTEINETPAADLEAVGGAYRHLTKATTTFLESSVEDGARPEDLARLVARLAAARRPRPRYVFPAKSRLLIAALERAPDRLADAMKARSIVLPDGSSGAVSATTHGGSS